jgi:hypothetical protein
MAAARLPGRLEVEMKALRLIASILALGSLVASGACHINMTSDDDDGVGGGTTTHTHTTTTTETSTGTPPGTTTGTATGTVEVHSLYINVPGATFVGGATPEPSIEAQSPILENGMGPGTLINGGSGLFEVGYSDPDGAATVDQLIVAADGDVGYFALPVDGSGANTTTVTINSDVTEPTLTLGFALVDSATLTSNYWITTFDLIQTGTGDVKVALSFDKDVDVDLHVVEPSGEDVYFNNKTSTTGGNLDLDSNAGCTIDGVNNENIFWAADTAPHGTYTVRVDYYSACEPTTVSYVVTVHNGAVVDTFTGSFTEADADAGGEGSGRTITTFTY